MPLGESKPPFSSPLVCALRAREGKPRGHRGHDTSINPFVVLFYCRSASATCDNGSLDEDPLQGVLKLEHSSRGAKDPHVAGSKNALHVITRTA